MDKTKNTFRIGGLECIIISIDLFQLQELGMKGSLVIEIPKIPRSAKVPESVKKPRAGPGRYMWHSRTWARRRGWQSSYEEFTTTENEKKGLSVAKILKNPQTNKCSYFNILRTF